jgi:hypothetical protein
MVTTEGNRTQPSMKSTYERPAQAFRPAPETVAESRTAEEVEALRFRDPLRFTSLIVSGATAGSLAAFGGLVLAVLGLSGVAPAYVSPVAGILLGLALVMLAGVHWARARMFDYALRESRRDWIVFLSGVIGLTIAGFVGIVASIVNVGFVVGAEFGGVAVIVLGLGLLMHSFMIEHVGRITERGLEGRRLRGPFAVNALTLAPWRDFFVGLGGVILGILAMMNVAPVILGFVALLTIGGALTFTASTICSATLATLKGACLKS